jgi:mannose-6-phosphate isomerase-like protein (cupin superfamily)
MTLRVPISRSTADHYTWGTHCDGWHLVRAEGLSVIHERMPSGTAESLHRHAKARQFFFVLSGAIEVELEGATHHIGVNAGIEVAPGEVHVVRNVSDIDAEFLVISQPPSHGDREVVAPAGSR